jgi:guanylate kinase
MKGNIPIEQDGREYWFRDEEDMLSGLQNGEYMEAAIIHNQQVSGCNIREIEKAQSKNKVAIKDIEPSGATSICNVKPDVIIIFVLPPNLDEWRRRLHSRSELPPKELRRRLVSARQELKAALSHDYYQFVINTTVPDAVRQVHNIVKNNSQEPELQRQGRELAQELLQAIAKS